jgi:cystathionine beta-lyase
MKYDFNTVIDRRGTSSVKWDYLDRVFKNTEVIPMWVADMDFTAPQPVIDAVVKRAQHGVYGYTEKPSSFYYSAADWLKKRHGWTINSRWITVCPGVVPTLNFCILALTEPGDKVLLQSPVYPPFFASIKNNGRVLVDSPLKLQGNKYVMDYEDLEAKLKDGVKLMLLCSPHNPVGRVWSREELLKVGELCIKYDVTIVSDEIHSDLILGNHRHTPLASLSEELAERTITCIAPSKTFNIAGFGTSLTITSNESLKKKLDNYLNSLGIEMANLFGITALEAAYNHGEEWLEQVLAYLEGNIDFLIEYINTHLPQIKVSKPEGTYLVWLDCRDLGLKQKELVDFFTNKARVGLNDGTPFSPEVEGFMRMNIACPRSVLEEGLKRIKQAVDKL